MLAIEEYEQCVFGLKPEIITQIARHLDTNLFVRDEEGYSYYGFYIDLSSDAIVVVTKNRNWDTVRITFTGDEMIHIECAGKKMIYPEKTRVGITLNQMLATYFDVPHAVSECGFPVDDRSDDDDFSVDNIFKIFELLADDKTSSDDEDVVTDHSDSDPVDTRCQWLPMHDDTLQ